MVSSTMSDPNTSLRHEGGHHGERTHDRNTDTSDTRASFAQQASENRGGREEMHWSKLTVRLFPDTGSRTSVGLCSLIQGDLSPALICRLCIQVSVNLQSPVLLIEADWSRPSLAESFGVPPEPGFGELLTSSTHRMYHCIHRTKYEHIWMMPAGCPSQVLSSPTLESRCREIYETLPPGLQHVIATLPTIRKRAALPIACSIVDQLALVVTPHSVAASEIRSIGRRLSSANTKVAGVIWTDNGMSESST